VCVVRDGAAVIDANRNQSNVWVQVRTTTTLGEINTVSYVPHAVLGYLDVSAVDPCPA